MATFEEIAERAAGQNTGDMLSATMFLIQDMAEALTVFEYNTARMFAAYNVAEVAGLRLDEYHQQVLERTQFVLDLLRRPIP